MENSAALAPMPMAIVRMATRENPGLLNSARVAARRSVMGASRPIGAANGKSQLEAGPLGWDQMHWGGTASGAGSSAEGCTCRRLITKVSKITKITKTFVRFVVF